MTRKDYIVLAEALQNALFNACDTHEGSNVSQTLAVIEAVTDALDAAYPNFNRAKFERACGIPD